MLLKSLFRETKEECGLDVSELDQVGTLIFEFVGEPQLLEVHVFRTEQYTGTVTESEGESGTNYCMYLPGQTCANHECIRVNDQSVLQNRFHAFCPKSENFVRIMVLSDTPFYRP